MASTHGHLQSNEYGNESESVSSSAHRTCKIVLQQFVLVSVALMRAPFRMAHLISRARRCPAVTLACSDCAVGYSFCSSCLSNWSPSHRNFRDALAGSLPSSIASLLRFVEEYEHANRTRKSIGSYQTRVCEMKSVKIRCETTCLVAAVKFQKVQKFKKKKKPSSLSGFN
jgi:hypothetical protein